ncbi:ORF-31 [Agrotis segetum nucleopolyhedrovirus A]|uniref:ORF-31 n=1 Tax=Agrotis segetum nuclear polyhedrosis virus TaxID=1962501 RepID=Q287P1_NPVAS|nr:ORF-31 [Agrotis segetum nucleopolyhedrovirus A]AAZ38197.1 ORF-31 [Agrotis segetum nucleopolyhedrovirus A]
MRFDTVPLVLMCLFVVGDVAGALNNLTVNSLAMHNLTVNSLAMLNERCVSIKFDTNNIDCNNVFLVDQFAKQEFDFRDVMEMRRFAEWISLLSSMQRYAPQSHTLANVATFLDRMTRIDNMAEINRKLQIAADIVYKNVAELYARYHSLKQFHETWLSFQNFFNYYIIWSPARYKTLLAMYATIRKTMSDNHHTTTQIDNAAAKLMELTMEYPLTMLTQQYIRQEAYIYFVSKLNSTERKRFGGMYEAIEAQQFPQKTVIKSGPVNLIVHHDIHTLDTLNRMQEESNYVYDNFRALWRRLNMSFYHMSKDVDMYVYKNKSEYKRTGLLLVHSVDNGGVAEFRWRPRKIQSSVYFDGDSIPRAFGHELFHCLLYTTNRRIFDRPNCHWFLEGAANRFGFRKCFWRDHFDLRTYQHKTIDEIVRANYGNNILYPMGSALVSFLYEKRSEVLRRAVLTRNFTIVSDPRMELEFSRYKQNKLDECNYVRGKQKIVLNTVQTQYKIAVTNATFAHCRKYITIEFDDCAFILTRDRLYFEHRVRGGINAQRIIGYNHNDVSQFDFDFLQKGLIKLSARYLLNDTDDPLMIADKFFSVDDKYSYAANASCDADADMRYVIASLTLALPMRTSTLFANANSLSEAERIVRRIEQTAMSCRTFTPPPVNVTGRLRTYVENIYHLRDEHIALANLVKPVDFAGNTILHLAAVLNKRLFLRLAQQHENIVTQVMNHKNHTPVWLFENTQNYMRRFSHEPSRYCMSHVPGDYIFNIGHTQYRTVEKNATAQTVEKIFKTARVETNSTAVTEQIVTAAETIVKENHSVLNNNSKNNLLSITISSSNSSGSNTRQHSYIYKDCKVLH